MSILKNRVLIEVNGNSPQKFILKLNHNKIDLLKINKINEKKYNILINYEDLKKVKKINTIYKIKVLNYYGIVKILKLLFNFYHVIIITFLGIMGLYLLSNVIFSVEIVTNDSEMKEKLLNTLSELDISKYHLKRNYEYLQQAKDKILKEYSDEIEWIEINNIGTKYIVKYEPKIINKTKENDNYKNIVAKKNAVILSIYASSGNILKSKNTYVNKGDIIISSDIYLNNEKKDKVPVVGKVYGEVWYETKVVYPFNYFAQKKTGKKNKYFRLKVINKKIDVFKFKSFNDKIDIESKIIKNSLLPIGFYKVIEEEVETKTGMNVVEELRLLAVNYAYEKLNETLKDDEYIIKSKILDSKIIPKGIQMTIFFSVAEDIGMYH